jgi:hypothetical protein
MTQIRTAVALCKEGLEGPPLTAACGSVQTNAAAHAPIAT